MLNDVVIHAEEEEWRKVILYPTATMDIVKKFAVSQIKHSMMP